MNRFLLPTLACGLVLGPTGSANAGLLLEHAFHSNAVNYCQAFTPGPSNTVRNRVVGVENIGAAPVAVACAFHSQESLLYTEPRELTLFVSNTGSATISINCTLLVGSFGEPGAYAVSRSATVAGNSVPGQFIRFTAADNPTPAATTLGSQLVGVNCTLPPGGGINDTELVWDELL